MCQRTLHRLYHFIFAKFLRFQRTFPALPFFRRKVDIRTSHRLHHFILAKFLKFQETFFKKFLVSRFGADSPNIQCTQKKHGIAVLFIIYHKQLELRSKPCFKGLFVKSPLKIRKNFCQNEWIHSAGNSFAYFSYKKSTVAYLFSKKGKARRSENCSSFTSALS